MKRSRVPDYIVPFFPNEVTFHHVIGTDVLVMGKLVQTCRGIRKWLVEQPDCYYHLFKHTFPNEFCILHDLLIHEKDVATIFDEEQYEAFVGDDEIVDVNNEAMMLFSSSFQDSYGSNIPIELDVIMDFEFTELIQCANPEEVNVDKEVIREVYGKFCKPSNPRIIQKCKEDPTFALKMARIYNRFIHPFGHPDASYYTVYQSDARRMLCSILRSMNKFIKCDMDEEYDAYSPVLTVDAGLVRLRSQLLKTPGFTLIGEDAYKLFDMEEFFDWGGEIVGDPWLDDSSSLSSSSICEDDDDDNFDKKDRVLSFIDKLSNRLDYKILPPKRDATEVYKWWQTKVLPYIETLKKRSPEMVPPDDDWQLDLDPSSLISVVDPNRGDTLYIETIDDKLFKEAVTALFNQIPPTHSVKFIPKRTRRRHALLATYRDDFQKDNNRVRLENRYFSMLLYRLLNDRFYNDSAPDD